MLASSKIRFVKWWLTFCLLCQSEEDEPKFSYWQLVSTVCCLCVCVWAAMSNKLDPHWLSDPSRYVSKVSPWQRVYYCRKCPQQGQPSPEGDSLSICNWKWVQARTHTHTQTNTLCQWSVFRCVKVDHSKRSWPSLTGKIRLCHTHTHIHTHTHTPVEQHTDTSDSQHWRLKRWDLLF